MLSMHAVNKAIHKLPVLKDIHLNLKKSSITALIGANGAGKSTLLRLLSGVYHADSGDILLDDKPVFDSIESKRRIFFLPDKPYFLPSYHLMDMCLFYKNYYPKFDVSYLKEMAQNFELDPYRKLSTFSKGMRQQAGLLLALASGADYLLCDETFDGLDPVKRQAIRRLFASWVSDGKSVLTTTHNLRESEDLCDHILFLYDGHIVLDQYLDDTKDTAIQVQAAFTNLISEDMFASLSPLQFEKRGRMIKFITKMSEEKVHQTLETFSPLYVECLPLTLEEYFMTEMEVRGYGLSALTFSLKNDL